MGEQAKEDAKTYVFEEIEVFEPNEEKKDSVSKLKTKDNILKIIKDMERNLFQRNLTSDEIKNGI